MKEKHNISQINSVAPMAVQSQQDFSTHQKTSFPFTETQAIPKFYKIVLQAADRVAGDITNATFNVNLPNPLPKNAVLCVKDFVFFATSTILEYKKPYVVRMPQLLAENSYQSDTNSSSDILFVGKEAYCNQVVAGTAGVPIQNPYFFNNRQITIKVDTLTDIVNWTLVLIIYAYE